MESPPGTTRGVTPDTTGKPLGTLGEAYPAYVSFDPEAPWKRKRRRAKHAVPLPAR